MIAQIILPKNYIHKICIGTNNSAKVWFKILIIKCYLEICKRINIHIENIIMVQINPRKKYKLKKIVQSILLKITNKT